MVEIDMHLGTGVPLYHQIAEQFKNQIASGKLAPGVQLPTVRDLAQRLDLNPSTVAKAYVELEREGIIVTRRGGGSFVAGRTDNLFMAKVREDRLSSIVSRAVLEALSLGFDPDEVEADFALHLARWRENRNKSTPVDRPVTTVDAQLVFVGSHDMALDLLFGQLRRARPDLAVSVVYSGSLAGLIAIEQGGSHLAGCHLFDEETGEYNWPYIRRLLPGQDVVLVTVVERTQGLMILKGNPLNIQGMADLARPGLRLVNRQRGAGTRVLLDLSLNKLGITAKEIAGYEREEETHLGVASAIADGSADVGLGIYAASRSLGLDFIPIQKERYDLAMLRSTMERPEVQSLLDILSKDEFRRVVSAMGGYDVTNSGKVLTAPPVPHYGA